MLPSPAYTTAEEYLAMERASDTRHEYLDGQVIAMVGASLRHGIILGNVFASLHAQLRTSGCSVVPNDLRVRVDDTAYTYPDVVVVCGEPMLEDEYVDTLLNPMLIVEVLSPSTESYDRSGKFYRYQQIASLQGYLLVAQAQPQVDYFQRQSDTGWSYEHAEGSGRTTAPSADRCHAGAG